MGKETRPMAPRGRAIPKRFKYAQQRWDALVNETLLSCLDTNLSPRSTAPEIWGKLQRDYGIKSIEEYIRAKDNWTSFRRPLKSTMNQHIAEYKRRLEEYFHSQAEVNI
jgi:hypothetical protein